MISLADILRENLEHDATAAGMTPEAFHLHSIEAECELQERHERLAAADDAARAARAAAGATRTEDMRDLSCRGFR